MSTMCNLSEKQINSHKKRFKNKTGASESFKYLKGLEQNQRYGLINDRLDKSKQRGVS